MKLTDKLRDVAADWVWEHTPCCREMARLLSRECDAPLPLNLRIRMRLHLFFCRWCTRYRHQIRLVNQLLAALSRHHCEHGHEQLSEATKDRIRKALKEK